MLADSGIGAILAEAGYVAVGSYSMRTMTWRDLDFDRPEEAPDWERHWEVGTRLARTGWCIRLNCTDCYRQQTVGFEPGLYWGVRAVHPARKEPVPPDDPTIWKLDLWTIEPAYFERNALQRNTWMSRITQEARSQVLAIKEAVCDEPEYRHTMLSVHIYEAVLEHGVRDAAAFREWWESRYGGDEG
jgi:hypothetical protein